MPKYEVAYHMHVGRNGTIKIEAPNESVARIKFSQMVKENPWALVNVPGLKSDVQDRSAYLEIVDDWVEEVTDANGI